MSSIVIASVLILIIVFISMVLVSIHNKHRKRIAIELVDRSDELGEGNNLSFTHKEIMENFIIGLDELRKKLFVLRKANNKYDFQVIDLREVKRCSKKKIYKSINMGIIKKERYENHIDKIALEFDYIDNRDPVQISFYESGGNHLFEMFELEQKATTWEIILTKSINSILKITA